MTVTDERGASALLVAGAMVFILGAAALAVDTSSFYEDARSSQTTADLTCLAGVTELPNTTAAITAAADIARLNWPEKTLSAPSISGTTGLMSDGAGNTVTITANHGGDPNSMSVVVSERAESDFAGVLGTSSVNVVQDAVCRAGEATSGNGIMPLGALGGSFSGDLFDCASKVTGNCGALAPVGSGASVWRDALENGVDVDMQKHHGNWGSSGHSHGQPRYGVHERRANVQCIRHRAGKHDRAVQPRDRKSALEDCRCRLRPGR